MLLITCQGCHAIGFTEDHANPDNAVQCDCCPTHESHDQHVAAVRETGDARCRPVTITLVPGSEAMPSPLVMHAAAPGSK